MNGYLALFDVCSLILYFYIPILVFARVFYYTKQFNELPKIDLAFFLYFFGTNKIKLWSLIIFLCFFISFMLSFKFLRFDYYSIVNSIPQFLLSFLLGFSLGVNIGYRFYVNNKNLNFSASATDRRKYYLCNALLLFSFIAMKVFFHHH